MQELLLAVSKCTRKIFYWVSFPGWQIDALVKRPEHSRKIRRRMKTGRGQSLCRHSHHLTLLVGHKWCLKGVFECTHCFLRKDFAYYACKLNWTFQVPFQLSPDSLSWQTARCRGDEMKIISVDILLLYYIYI